MIKTTGKVGRLSKLSSLIKHIYEKPKANIILKSILALLFIKQGEKKVKTR